MADKTWKAAERRVAKFFGSTRNPLSGENSKHTGSDTLSEFFFIETKYRARQAVVELLQATMEKAARECEGDKIAALALVAKGRLGFAVVVHSLDLEDFCYQFLEKSRHWKVSAE